MVDNGTLSEDTIQLLARSLHQARSAITSLLDDDASTLASRKTLSTLLEEHLVVLPTLQSQLTGRMTPSNRTKLPSETLLDALQFLDYDSVVTLKFVSSLHRGLAQKCIDQYQATAEAMVVILEENALRVFCPAKRSERTRVAVCHRAESHSTCRGRLNFKTILSYMRGDWFCAYEHIAEAAVKLRALLGFNRVEHMEIHADWDDVMMRRLLTYVPMMKSARTVRLGHPNGGGLAAIVPVALPPHQLPAHRIESASILRFIEYFDSVDTLWVHGEDGATFDWKALRHPKIQCLEDLRMTNLLEEPNVEEVLCYCSQPFATNALPYRRLALLGVPLGKTFVKRISQVFVVAEHELFVRFECDAELTNEDIAFDTEPPYDMDVESPSIRAVISRNLHVGLFRLPKKGGRMYYVITNDKKIIVDYN